jgi:prophage regulatory protein
MERNRIIRKKEVLDLVGLSDVSVWRWERAGKFPKRIQLGGNSVGWLESEIQAWIQNRANNRRQKAA